MKLEKAQENVRKSDHSLPWSIFLSLQEAVAVLLQKIQRKAQRLELCLQSFRILASYEYKRLTYNLPAY